MKPTPTPLTNINLPPETQVPILLSAGDLLQLVITLRTMPTTLQPVVAVAMAESIRQQVLSFGIAKSKPPGPVEAGMKG